MTAKILAIANQKGGVGKTTTAVNLSTALAAMGQRTLLIDLDPQGNASTGVGVHNRANRVGVYEVILGDTDISRAITPTSIPKLSLLSSSVDLAAAEIELATLDRREYRLKDALSNISSEFEWVIIDCPPALGLLTINSLTAADKILVPLQCEYYALEGLSHLLGTILRVRDVFNKRLELFGVVLTMYDRRSSLSRLVEDDVRKTLKSKVFTTCIPRNVKISEAPSHGQPALLYDVNCIGSAAYIKFAAELLKKEWR